MLSNLDDRLLPAMFTSIRVLSNLDDLAIVIPLTAMFTEDESDWIYVNPAIITTINALLKLVYVSKTGRLL
jgi:hypothetical protein